MEHELETRIFYTNLHECGRYFLRIPFQLTFGNKDNLKGNPLFCLHSGWKSSLLNFGNHLIKIFPC